MCVSGADTDIATKMHQYQYLRKLFVIVFLHKIMGHYNSSWTGWFRDNFQSCAPAADMLLPFSSTLKGHTFIILSPLKLLQQNPVCMI